MHVERAYIQQQDGEYLNETGFSMARGCRELGIEVVGFEAEFLPDLHIRKETLVHGGVHTVRRALRILGVKEPQVDGAPEQVVPFFGRQLWTTTMRDVRKGPFRKMFIKPLREHKAFNGYVLNGEFRDLIRTAAIDDDVEILASDVVEFLVEYRLFVHRGIVIGCKNYRGDWTKTIDFNEAFLCAAAYTKAPVAYSLDMGLTSEGRTLVAEVNDAFSLGSYGLPSVQYAQMVEDRWIEMVNSV